MISKLLNCSITNTQDIYRFFKREFAMTPKKQTSTTIAMPPCDGQSGLPIIWRSGRSGRRGIGVVTLSIASVK